MYTDIKHDSLTDLDGFVINNTNGLYICGIDKIRFDDFNGVILHIFKVVFGLAYILLIMNVYN